jgi:protein-S-isoprenylcysteine O-methyltransferase Ste14
MSLNSIRIGALVRTFVFAVLFVAGVLIYLPWGVGIFRPRHFLGWHAVGLLPLAAGTYIILLCLFAFAWQGRGTPAPFDAPRELVAVALYRYVRNPMYWGAFLILLGQSILFGHDRGALWYFALFAACAHLFVMAYEEPTLSRKFGASYQEYLRNVPRWIPRRKPWIRTQPDIKLRG